MSTVALFKNPFAPKKATLRKAMTSSPLELTTVERAREFGMDYKTAHFLLNGQSFRFDASTGEWFDGKYHSLSIYKI